MSTISVLELEMKIFEFEEVSVVIRKDPFSQVKPYTHRHKLGDGAKVSALIERVRSCLPDDVCFVIVDGHGKTQRPDRTTLGFIRNSYVVKD